jgi:prepilin-type N-terminal cleavage/methylation domain-containing protein
MKTYFSKSKGFTIVEMVIAITIFALMSVTITSVYIQTTYSGERMKKVRYLSETAREITERIADDIRVQ